jgi:hypothetical protein
MLRNDPKSSALSEEKIKRKRSIANEFCTGVAQFDAMGGGGSADLCPGAYDDGSLPEARVY